MLVCSFVGWAGPTKKIRVLNASKIDLEANSPIQEEVVVRFFFPERAKTNPKLWNYIILINIFLGE